MTILIIALKGENAMLLFCGLFVSQVRNILLLGVLACFCPPSFAVRRCQTDADSAFFDLEPQAALLVVGLLAQFRKLGGIGQQPVLQFGIVGVDLCGGVTAMSKNLSNFYHC